MKVLSKFLKGIVEVFNIVAIISLVAMLLLVCANVIMRYIFNNPIPGTYELTQMLMICLSPCIAVNIMAKECVWVDVLTSRFGRIGQMIIDIITLPFATLIIGIMAWQGYNMIWTSIEKNSYTQIMTFRLYEWPFRTVYFLAMTMSAIAALVFTIERFAEYKGGGVPVDKNEVDRAVEEVGDLSASGKEDKDE
ncbi:MAG: TRAP transporter small permease [Eubacterium sp.]|nr:TRAP transporter small permease [Eubacterium sp.]